ncbi:hypothetical protein BaRGS_00030520, partial [Batillaria attramentaria]
IRACPGVSDVVVVRVPDPHVNEELCACVMLTSGDVSVEHVRQFVEDIITSADDPLSPLPRYYVKFQSFPMTDTHKPRRKLIKQQAVQRAHASHYVQPSLHASVLVMSKFITVVEALKQRAENDGNKPAFIFRDQYGGRRVLPWEQIYRLGGRWAAVLRSGSVGQGHLVMNTLPNSPERVISETGILLSGAASLNGQCQLADGSDLLRALRLSRATAIVLDPDVPNSPWNVLEKRVAITGNSAVTSEELPDLKRVYKVRRNPENVGEDFMAADIELSLSPLGWSGGWTGNTFMSGITRVLYDVRNGGPPADMAEFVWKSVQEERCTRLFLLPPVIIGVVQRLNRQGDGAAGSMLRGDWKPDYIFTGGMPISRTHVQAASILAKEVVTMYGTTEGFVVACYHVPDPDTYVDHEVIICHGVDMRVVDEKDEDTPLPPGQIGNILVKRRGMFTGYLHDPAATAAAFTSDGFFRTGDVGKMDARGHLIVEGRGGDAIMRGAYIFYPAWLEARIRACPDVSDVVVVGVPDPHVNEELCACVVLTSDGVNVEHVRQFVEKDIITSADDPLSPRPRYYVRFQSFPMTDTHKPRRKLIKQQAAQRFQRE